MQLRIAKGFYIFLFFVVFLSLRSPVFAACSGLPSIGDKTLSNITCTIASTDGVDKTSSETSSTNNAVLQLNSGASITINSTGSLVVGSIILNGGSVAIDTGGTIKPSTPLYTVDADADGWMPTASPTLFIATASGRRRLGLMRGMAADCLDSSYSTTNVCFTCGNPLVVNHVAGPVSPVTTTISYGTVVSSLSGSSKCWITRNLGASQQATSATDATEASAGWYWAFNRMQGFRNDGTTLTPTTWNSSTDTASATWEASKDPCTLSLGTGWRIPTITEWANADGASGGNWSSHTNTFNSVLKIHSAGFLNQFTGAMTVRGSNGGYWSSTGAGAAQSTARILQISASTSVANSDQLKSIGYSVRCIKD
jgi:uncharacterized protein (TIGR02145 family)